MSSKRFAFTVTSVGTFAQLAIQHELNFIAIKYCLTVIVPRQRQLDSLI
jgi:hypothetical protein